MMISKLERRIEKLERSPASKPPPNPWGTAWLNALASLSLEDGDLVLAVVADREQEISRPWTEREAAAVKALEAAFALEAQRAGLTPSMLRASRNVGNWVSRSQRPRT
jgi:hypothetical protein